jgi:hypothetical protein
VGGCLWGQALAADKNGAVVEAYDCFENGDYDVKLHSWDGPDAGQTRVLAGSAQFEARPSIVYDPQGRLWIAYEVGPQNWGRDFGLLDFEAGSPLYNSRSVRVVCWSDGRLWKPKAVLPTSPNVLPPNEKNPRYAYPKLGLDGKGRLWLTYRQNFGTRSATLAGSYWLTFARRLDGDHWTEPIEIHQSDGLLDYRPSLLPHPGRGLLVIHNGDGRDCHPQTIANHVYASVLDLPGEPVEPQLLPHEPGSKGTSGGQAEAAAVQRIRAYRMEHGGKRYRFLRGDWHRHTEFSYDGVRDGSVEDMFRYARDVAALDWVVNTDHDSGNGREYAWWLLQKFTDAFQEPGQFTTLFGYERSVGYPHGHRNCLFARRGIQTLPRLAQPDPKKRVATIHADDTRMLYRYLHELDGICASHTSATNMGTDWRDHDPQVEPLVELYQGVRTSFEYPDAPRAGHDPKSGKSPVQPGGWHPDGFIDNALKKGYRLGFLASSDHLSTHISYCIALAEVPDRVSILDALKKRHCYAATDDIVLDIRCGAHLMGDEVQTSAPPRFEIHVVGTKPLAEIAVLKDSQVVTTVQPGKQEYQGSWQDPRPVPGRHYYYVRVRQNDEELAWSSPLWVDQTP